MKERPGSQLGHGSLVGITALMCVQMAHQVWWDVGKVVSHTS